MANINKVIYGGETLIDLTSDTVSKERVLAGDTFHGADGVIYEGECTFDSDTSADTATADEILETKTAHARGAALTGRMKNNGAVTGYIETKDGQYTVPQGYHDGSGKVSLKPTAIAGLTPTNIRVGMTVLGVTGTMSGSEDVKAQSKTVTPTKTGFTVNPDSGYNYLTSVQVSAIPYTTTLNAAGGLTATIG